MNNGDKKILIQAAAKSTGGDVRANENNIFFNGDYIQKDALEDVFEIKSGKDIDVNVFAVLGGLGKSPGGRDAALLAASELRGIFTDLNANPDLSIDDLVLEYINDVNEAIGVKSQRQNRRGAATIGLVIIRDSIAHIYNLGNTKIFYSHSGRVTKVSKDHMLRRGEPNLPGLDKNVSQFLGIYDNERELVPFRAKPIRLQNGDKILIANDSVVDYLNENSIEECLDTNKDAFGHCAEIVRISNGNGKGSRPSSALVIHATTQRFRMTTNMMLGLIGAGILIVGFILGYLMGYLVGNSSYGRNSSQQTTISSMEEVSSIDEMSSEEIDSSSEEISSQEDDTSSVLKATRVYFPAGKDVFTLDPGGQIDLKKYLSVRPAGADPGKITWTSSNTSIAVVDKNGICKVGSTGGVARITVKNEDGLGGYCDVECRVVAPAVTTTRTTTIITKRPEPEGQA